MKSIKAQLKVTELKRLNNSYYGNPAWRITAKDESVDFRTA